MKNNTVLLIMVRRYNDGTKVRIFRKNRPSKVYTLNTVNRVSLWGNLYIHLLTKFPNPYIDISVGGINITYYPKK